MPRPLVVTDDPVLLDELLRLAAAAGVEVEATGDPAAARRLWPAAPAVFVGADRVDALSALVPPRHEDCVLVGRDLDDASIWRRAVALGAGHVVFLPDAEDWLVGRLAAAGEERTGLGRIIAVLGGRGGAGATTLSVALAVTSQLKGFRTMLVDADPYGGGIDLVLGGEESTGPRWPDLSGSPLVCSGTSLAAALPRMRELTVLSWDRGSPLTIPPDKTASLLSAARRGADLVVVDLPRSFDETARVALRQAAPALVVVPAEVRACAAAARIAAAAGMVADDLRAVVRGPAPSGLTAELVAQAVGLPLAGWLPAEPGLVQALERGEPPARRGRGPLARFCGRLLDEVLGRPATGRSPTAAA